MKPNHSPPPRAAGTLLWLLAVLLTFILCFQHMLIQPSSGAQPPRVVMEAMGAFLPVNSAGQGESPIGGKGSEIINILLIGQDHQEGQSGARSDSMILCTFNKETRTLTMTSFLRDLYVPIPGHGRNRINAAYAFGGMSLLKKTVEHNFGLKIDGCVEVDFGQFAAIIDLLGGVEIELRQDEADAINKKTGSDLSEGRHLLTGEQALAYSRIRKLDRDGDFSRTARQRSVMRALLDAYKNASIPKLLLLLDDILPIITTDLSAGRVLTLAMEVLPLLSGTEFSSQSVPSPDNCTDQTIDGMSVLVADLEAVRKMLRKTLLSD